MRILSFVGLLLLAACRKTDDFAQQDDILIRNHLQALSISDYQHDENSGLYWYFTQTSGLELPTPTKTVEVRYRSLLLDGTLVSEVLAPNTQRIELRAAIVGWKLGLLNFPKRSIGVLLVPSRLAYGAEGLPPKIPANAVLRFEIELVEIHPHF